MMTFWPQIITPLKKKCRGRIKNLKYYGFLAMNGHKSQQEWTSSTSAKSGGAVLAAELRREMRKITSQIIHSNTGRHRRGSASERLKSHSVWERCDSAGERRKEQLIFPGYLWMFRYKRLYWESPSLQPVFSEGLIWRERCWRECGSDPCSPWVTHFCQYCTGLENFRGFLD